MGKTAGLRHWELWGVVVVLLVATALRLGGLRDVPPGLRYDELLDYRMIGRILAGERPLYFAESWGEEPLFLYLQAATLALVQASDWSLRLPAVLCGVLGVLAAWLAARRLFGPRVALLTAAGLAVSFWSIFYSREGIRIIALTPLHGLMVYFVWRGLERLPGRQRPGLVPSENTPGGPASAGSPPLKRGVRTLVQNTAGGPASAGSPSLKRGVRTLVQNTAGGPASAGSPPLKRGVRTLVQNAAGGPASAGSPSLKRGVRTLVQNTAGGPASAGSPPLKRGVRTLVQNAAGGPASAGSPPLKRGVRTLVRFNPGLLDLVLGGGCLGLSFYVYPAARLVPLLWILLCLYLALFHRPLFQRAWWGLLLVVLVAALIAMPLLLLVYGPARAEQRAGQLNEAWQALREGDPRPVLALAVQAAGMFVWRGDRDWLYNVSGRPIFDPLTGACFFLGLAFCAWRWRQARYALALLWLGVGLAPAMIAPPPASLSHSIAAQPPAYVLLAVGLDALWRRVQKRWAWAGLTLAAGVVAVHGVLSAHAYFITWASAPQVRELHQGSITAVARELDAHDPPGPVAIGAPYVNYWHPWNIAAFDLALRRTDMPVRWFNPAGGWIWPAGPGPTTFYFPADPLAPQSFDPALKPLFFADATLLPSATDDLAAFRVAHPAALEERLGALAQPALAWPPDLAYLPPPALPLIFGGRFALLGAEMQESTVSPGGQFRLITYWDVSAADPAPMVAFVHLTSDGQDLWGQYDWLDVWPVGLQPGDRFVQVHPVPVKPETPPGLYHVQLGLYRPDTLQRLPIAASATAAADRVWIGEMQVSQRSGISDQ